MHYFVLVWGVFIQIQAWRSGVLQLLDVVSGPKHQNQTAESLDPRRMHFQVWERLKIWRHSVACILNRNPSDVGNKRKMGQDSLISVSVQLFLIFFSY